MNFESFLEEVQTALNRLYDPTFQPSHLFGDLLTRRAATPAPWQEILLQTIHQMEPSTTTPPETRSRRIHQVLTYRYVQQLTQEDTAARLHITSRHVRREQSEAVHALAQILWQRATQSGDQSDPVVDWSSQLRQELTSLQRHVPEGVVAVDEILHRVVDLLTPVLANTTIAIHSGKPLSGTVAAVHAAGLRQLLVRSITEWARQLANVVIEMDARTQGDVILIQLIGSRAPIDHLRADPLVQELLAQYGGRFEIAQAAQATTLTISLPSASEIRVLVVDDNEDLLHFYRRYLQDTRYQITALTDGSLLLETLESVQPDIIVLDVMLPAADGWELLTTLRQHPLGRNLPILVCSVIQEEDLALALGATGYIAKPVRRAALLAALDAAFRTGKE